MSKVHPSGPFAAQFGDPLSTRRKPELNGAPSETQPSWHNTHPSQDHLKPDREQQLRLILLIAFRCTRAAAGGMIMVALPYLVLSNLHAGSLALAALYVVGVLSTAVLSIGVGHLADRWNYGKALLLTGVMVPISAWIVYADPTYWMICAASVIGGFAATGSLIGGGVGGAAQSVQSAVVARITTTANRTKYFSVLAFLSGISGAVGALLVHFFTVRDAFFVAAVLSLVGCAPLLFLHLPPYQPAKTVTREASSRAVRQFGITGMLNGFSQGLITPFLIPFFVLVYHLSRQHMSIFAALASTTASISLLAAPSLERRFGFVRSITFTRALGVVLLIIMALWHNLAFGLLIYLIYPALRIAALPAQQSALIERVEHGSMGRALAVNQVARLSASSAASICTGYLFDLSALEFPFFIYAVVMTANIVLYYRFFGRDGKKSDATALPISATDKGDAAPQKCAN